MKRKILIIGAGGIGSFLIPLLNKTGLYKITVNDPDIIEKKNISYQNFEADEIELKKLSSFPKEFKFKGTFANQWKRIGNAVMPKFMEHIARTIKDEIL